MTEIFIYLIGGAMRTGKTICARRLNVRTGVSFLSTDDLNYMLEAAAPQLGIGHDLPGTNWRAEREALAPYVEALAQIRLQEGIPLLIEGELLPASVGRILHTSPESVRACFLGTPAMDFGAKVAALEAWSQSAGDWLTDKPAAVLEWAARESIAASFEYRDAALALGIPFFDLSADFEEGVGKAVEYLVSGSQD